MRRQCLVVALLLGVSAGCEPPGSMQARRSSLKPDYAKATYDQALAYDVGRCTSGPPVACFQPSFVIVHVAEGYYTGTISWFKNAQSGVSSHYVVSSTTGAVTQMVEEKDTAYHVGAAIGSTSVGIEHEGFVASPAKWFTDVMYKGSADLVKDIADRWGFPADRCHVLGHDEVPDPKSPCTFGGAEHHTDPGTGWDWTKYMGYMGASGTKCAWDCKSTTGSIVGFVRSGSLLPTAPAVVGATVTSGSKTTTTDSKGFYRFDGLSLGYYYTIKVTAAGFQSATQYQAVVIPLDNYSSFALTPGGPSPDAGVKQDSGPQKKDTGSQPPADSGVPTTDGTPPKADKRIPGTDGVVPDDLAPEPDAEQPSGGGGGGCAIVSARSRAPLGALLLIALPLVLVARRLAVRGRLLR